MGKCIIRISGEDHHVFDHIYDEIEEDHFPVEVMEDDDVDVIEAQKCHRKEKTYVKSICKYCGKEIKR
jgi:hypothetical protein